jgi:hypothetical protein
MHCRVLWILIACFWLYPVYAEDNVEQRLERLEKQMQQVLDALTKQGLLPSKTTNESPAVVPQQSPMSIQYGGYADIRYYITESILGDSPPDTPPVSSGRVALGDQVGLQPKAYQVSEGSLFSAYRDPSRYRSAGLWLEASLPIMQQGLHLFTVMTQPAREGGSAVTTTMTVKLWLDNRLLFDINSTPKWHSWSQSLELAPGNYKVKLWLNSTSPGFGPTPLDSSLRLKLKRPGDAAPFPLERLLTVPTRH